MIGASIFELDGGLKLREFKFRDEDSEWNIGVRAYRVSENDIDGLFDNDNEREYRLSSSDYISSLCDLQLSPKQLADFAGGLKRW